MQRRSFLASLSGALAWQTLRSLHVDAQPTVLMKYPFTVGIASGDPAPHGVVLWTRLVPDLHMPDYGLPLGPVGVRWEIASDESMKKIVANGTVAATPELNHSVRVDVQGLKPSREYFYRFHAGGATSPVGRTKTAPAPNAPADKVRFAFASCQSYENGYYTAHRDMAKADVDVVVFLGDYIYERHNPNVDCYRLHDFTDVKTLAEYRHHYAQYKSDPDLMACHQSHAWIVTPDDHEVENDWAGDHGTRSNREELIARRTAAYRAYYENMPLRQLCFPQGSHMQLYRNVSYGKLLQFAVLDTRQFRTPQPCNDKPVANCTGRLDPNGTMMGATQEAWLMDSLSKSTAQWNVIANQVLFAQSVTNTAAGPFYGADDWDGYAVQRLRLTKFLGERKPRNPFIITGDAHHTRVNNILENPDDKSSPIVASEFLGTSISSGSDGVNKAPSDDRTMSANSNIVYMNHKRGYVLCEADSKKMTSELRVADKVSVKDGTVSAIARFIVDSDKKGIRQDS